MGAPGTVTVNGAARELAGPLPLPRLLADLGLVAGSVVVELNRVALTPSEVPGATVRPGDCVEIVRAVAGG